MPRLDPGLRDLGRNSALDLILAAIAAGGVGCGEAHRGGPPPERTGTPLTAESAGYLSPPLVTGVVHGAGVVVSGRASPGARIRLASPDGGEFTTAAGADGAWRLALPAATVPRMFAVSAEAHGRLLRAEGALVVLPPPATPAVLARAGYAALPVSAAAVSAPVIVALDIDAGGSSAVGGLAAPNSRVELSVDGQASDVDLADAGGRFALSGPRAQPLRPGRHRFSVSGAQGSASAMATLSPLAPLGGAAMRASLTPEGWRLDWTVPGGGVQSTLVLDVPAGGMRP